MVRTRTRVYSKYILLLDKSLLIHERFVSRKSLGGKVADVFISSKKGTSIDCAYDEMINELLDGFPIIGWRTFLFNCLNDEIIDKMNSPVIIGCGMLYYYGLPGQKEDQALYSNQFPNARGMFLTCALRNVIDSSINFVENSDDKIFDINGKNKILKLIEHCRIENNWGSLSFFENTLKEIMFMDYLFTQRRMRKTRHDGSHWYVTSIFKDYAREEISILGIHKLIVEVNSVSHAYPRYPYFVED